MPDQQIKLAARLAALALAFALSGCSGGGSNSGQQSQGNGPFGLFGPKQDPNRDLTPAQGRKLIADIHKNPSRMQKLTPPERRFLASAAAADAESNVP